MINFMSTKLNPEMYKVLVIGDGGVGKSALTVQYVSHIFLDFHDPTIEDVYQTQRVIDGETCVLNILDTAGQDELQTALHESYFHQGDGYIAVYSITDIRSFERLRSHIHTLRKLRNLEKVPIVIVGNKIDLFAERTVSTAEGISLAREVGCPFYEASAATTINVDDVFSGVVRKIRQKQNEDCANNFRAMKPKIKMLRKFVNRKFHNTMSHLRAFSQST